jgi:proteasome lid subunit RPN8/RPN11
VATVLKPAWAAWTGVQFRRQEAVEQRAALLGQGLHCVGFWHTHPEPECRPSPTDAQLAADHADAAKATLNGLVFVIASNRPAFQGWYVAIHDGTKFHQTMLTPPMTSPGRWAQT